MVMHLHYNVGGIEGKCVKRITLFSPVYFFELALRWLLALMLLLEMDGMFLII